MFEIWKIIERDRISYLDDEHIRLFSYWQWKFVVFVFAVVTVAVIPIINLDFLNTLISVFGILIGFGISVLFYIADQNKSVPEEHSQLKREDLLRLKRVIKMRNFVFYRMSYFVFCSISIIVFAIAIVTFSFVQISDVREFVSSSIFSIIEFSNQAAKWVVYFALYFLVFEAVRSLYSLMGALIYYFNYRLKHNI